MSFRINLKAVFVLGIMMMFLIDASAQSYFPERQNITLEYIRKDVADGRFRWRQVMRIKDMTDEGAFTRFTSESIFTGKNGKPLYRSAVNETLLVEKSSGDVSVDVGAFMASYIKAITGFNATATRVELSTLPADIQPGDTLPIVHAQAKVGPITYSVLIDDRKVLRAETLEVPAGKFDCIVVSEHRVESGLGHNRNLTNDTWYSKGVGYVRHDTYIKGKLETSEKLQVIR